MLYLTTADPILTSTAAQPSSLPLVVKVVGTVFSWATTIYFLWVRKQPEKITRLDNFSQTQNISIVTVAIFVMLCWGIFGKSNSVVPLAVLATVLAIIGIGVFFEMVHITRKNSSAPDVLVLLCFLVYTAFLSCGLTAAAVSVVLLVSPLNARAGTALVKPDQYLVTMNVSGTSTTTEDKDVPFTFTSGQQNFDCEQVSGFKVIASLPPGATLPAKPTAAFANAANANIVGNPAIADSGLSATGTLQGISYEHFPFGVKNCPGGGHGELILSGNYHTSTAHDLPVTRTIKNDLNTAITAPLPVTLPDFKISQIEIECQSLTTANAQWRMLLSPSHTVDNQGPLTASYDVGKKEVDLSVKKMN